MLSWSALGSCRKKGSKGPDPTFYETINACWSMQFWSIMDLMCEFELITLLTLVEVGKVSHFNGRRQDPPSTTYYTSHDNPMECYFIVLWKGLKATLDHFCLKIWILKCIKWLWKLKPNPVWKCTSFESSSALSDFEWQACYQLVRAHTHKRIYIHYMANHGKSQLIVRYLLSEDSLMCFQQCFVSFSWYTAWKIYIVLQ